MDSLTIAPSTETLTFDLAVGGKVCAMFVVSYSADADLKRELKKLEKSGVTIILKTGDPYINEESVAKLFDLPE